MQCSIIWREFSAHREIKVTVLRRTQLFTLHSTLQSIVLRLRSFYLCTISIQRNSSVTIVPPSFLLVNGLVFVFVRNSRLKSCRYANDLAHFLPPSSVKHFKQSATGYFFFQLRKVEIKANYSGFKKNSILRQCIQMTYEDWVDEQNSD